MSQLILMIAKIDELDNPESLTELWRGAMPMVNQLDITPAHYLDELESQVSETGWEAMRHLLVEQWRLTDGRLVEEFRQEQAGAVVGVGHDLLQVASRLGVVQLPRQVCFLPGSERHTLPGNAGLPEHEGQVTTRGLQEWVCVSPQDLPFGTTGRLLGWRAPEPEVMSETQARRWVCRHGGWIRQAEYTSCILYFIHTPCKFGTWISLAPPARAGVGFELQVPIRVLGGFTSPRLVSAGCPYTCGLRSQF